MLPDAYSMTHLAEVINLLSDRLFFCDFYENVINASVDRTHASLIRNKIDGCR